MKSIKRSTERAHQLFQLLKKLELFSTLGLYDHIDDIYDVWGYISRMDEESKKLKDE